MAHITGKKPPNPKNGAYKKTYDLYSMKIKYSERVSCENTFSLKHELRASFFTVIRAACIAGLNGI